MGDRLSRARRRKMKKYKQQETTVASETPENLMQCSQQNISSELDEMERSVERSRSNIESEIAVMKESNQRLTNEIQKLERRQKELQQAEKQMTTQQQTVARQEESSTLEGVSRRYIRGIDGLRTLAVIGVILYHLLPASMRGGYLGVTLFFVISGYLMTDIIYTQVKKNTFSLKQFYVRRIRRLMPAVIIMLMVCGAVIPFINKDFLVHFRSVVVTSILNVNNWWQLMTGGNYFDKFAEVAPFENLWSLSVEGQFYIIYPIILAFLLRKLGWKWSMFFMVIGTLFSSVEMAMLYDPKNVTRVYYGTDTRLFSLLIGAVIALIIREHGDAIKEWFAGKLGTFVAGTSLIVTLWSFFVISDQIPFVYQGGMLLLSIFDALLLLVLIVNPRIEQWFIHPFFKWCGSRSYEIYLWQYPVMIIMDKMWKVPQSQHVMFALAQVLIIIALAELTHRFVQALYRFMASIKEVGWKKSTVRYAPMWLVTVVIAVFFVTGFVDAPTKLVAANNNLEATLKQNQEALKKKQQHANKKVKPLTPGQKLQQQTKKQVQQALAGDDSVLPLNKAQRKVASRLNVTAIGDSVLLNASMKLDKLMPNMMIDAVVGRQIADSFSIVEQLKASGRLAPIVLFALGTNGPTYDESEFNHMMSLLRDKQVFFVNTKSELYWQDEVNDKLAAVAKKYKNVHIIDWHQLSQNKVNWFGDDGTHMSNIGGKAYAEFVAKNIIAYQTTKHAKRTS